MSGKTVGVVAGAVIGAVIGYFVPAIGVVNGAMLGAQIGGLGGGIYDALNSSSKPFTGGPRLSDLSVQTATYGAPIQRVYGTIAVWGNIFWLENNQLKETEKTQKSSGGGGKGLSSLVGGGSSTRVYSYSATIAVGLCEGPITGIRRIWIGPKLVYDIGSSDEQELIASIEFGANFKLYLGTEDQLSDPRMQATLGVANVPAYRGLAYIVFSDLGLGDYGNSLPVAQIKVEVVKDGALDYLLELKEESNHIYRPADIFLQNNYLYVVTNLEENFNLDNAAVFKIFDIGDPVKPLLVSSTILPTRYGDSIIVVDNYAYIGIDWNNRIFIYNVAIKAAPSLVSTTILNDGYSPLKIAVKGLNVYCLTLLYLHIIDTGNIKHPVAAAKLSLNTVAARDIKLFDDYAFITSASGLIVVDIANSSNPVIVTTVSLQDATGVTKCRIDGNYLYVISNYSNLQIFDISTPASPVSVFNSAILAGVFGDIKDLAIVNNHLYVAGSGLLKVFRLETPIDPVFVGSIAIAGGLTYGDMSIAASDTWIYVAGSSYLDGYVNDRLQTFFFIEPTIASNQIPLSEIVSAETLQSNLLTAGDIDVTSLVPMVRGYKIGQVSTIRSVIEPLQASWFFDAVQSGYKIKYILRGLSSIASISHEELDAREAGKAPGVQFLTSREMETILPAKVSVKFYDVEREYDTGNQYAERINTGAVNVNEVDLAICLTTAEGAQKAATLLYLYWLERYDLAFSLPPVYAYLEPVDIITITTENGVFELRLTSIHYTSDGRLDCKAKLNHAALYSQAQITGEPGQSTGVHVLLPGPTVYEILDIPLLQDNYDYAGYPLAMAGRLAGWTGGELLVTDDGGQSWIYLQSVQPPGATMGFASTALGAHGGTVLDKSSLLTVRLYHGELSSVTEAQMFAGSNWFAYGVNGRYEVIAAQNCVLQGDGTYILSDFLRGQMGTEWATGLHAVGDALVHLSSTELEFILTNTALIGVSRTYRGITQGKLIDSDEDREFTYNAVNLEPLSPCALTGSRHPTTNDWTLTWTRRSRYAGWRSYVDADLAEASEAYEIDIFSSNTYATLKRTLSVSAPTAAYTSAQQFADFGSNQSTLYVKIYQLSAIVGRGYPLTVRFPDIYAYALLLHCNGANGGTTFIDSSANQKTVTPTLATTSTAQSKFGGASLVISGSGQYLTVTDSTDFEIGTDDFTLEAWVYISSFSPSLQTILNIGSYTTGILFRLQSNRIEAYVLGVQKTFSCTVPTGAWVHCALCRSSGVLRAFLNGVQVGSDIATTSSIPHAALIIGKSAHNAGEYINGYLDEVTVVVGEGKYVGNFTPATSEF